MSGTTSIPSNSAGPVSAHVNDAWFELRHQLNYSAVEFSRVLHCSSTSWFSPFNAHAVEHMFEQGGDAGTEKLIAFESRYTGRHADQFARDCKLDERDIEAHHHCGMQTRCN